MSSESTNTCCSVHSLDVFCSTSTFQETLRACQHAEIHLICQSDHESQVQLDLESMLWQPLLGLWHPKSTENCAFENLHKEQADLSTLQSAVYFLV